MRTTTFARLRRGGFTLIELLIVIGLLGALTALVLPSMMADREETLGNVCDYNQAGTLRVLKQYQQITGELPSGMHSGLKVATGASSISDAIDGLPDAQAVNLADSDSYHSLSASEANALRSVGITAVAYDTGLHYQPVAEGTSVLRVTRGWKDDETNEYQFNGKKVSEIEDVDGGTVLVLYVAPTTDWAAGSGDNSDWSMGNVKISLDLDGKCPIPTSAATVSEAQAEADALVGETGNNLTWVDGCEWTTIGNTSSRVATYFDDSGAGDPVQGTVTFKIVDHTGGGLTELIGTSCPECGVLNK